MQFIPILPIKQQAAGVNRYMLSLAHLYQNSRYSSFFKKLHERNHYVIMDNAAYEMPEPYSIDKLWELIVYFGASELVLPDVLLKSQATLDATHDALIFLRKQDRLGLLRKYLRQLMIVPQGESMLEWAINLDALIELYKEFLPEMPYTIGIAKHTRSYSGGRLKLVHHIVSKNIPHADLHLLGIGESLEELREIALSYGHKIRTVDSARPAVYAWADIFVRYGNMLPHIKRPEGFFDIDLHEPTPKTWKLRQNIATYHWVTKSEGDPAWRQSKFLP